MENLILAKIVLVLVICVNVARSDYSCLCNYNVESAVLPTMDKYADPLGYIYEFDCLPQVERNSSWIKVAYEQQVGYVLGNAQTLSQVCPGDVDIIHLLDSTTTGFPSKLTTHQNLLSVSIQSSVSTSIVSKVTETLMTSTTIKTPISSTATEKTITSMSTGTPITLNSLETPITSTATASPITSTATEIPMTSTATASPMTSTATEIPITSTETETPMTSTEAETPMTSTSSKTPITLTASETSMTPTETNTPMTSTASKTSMTSTEAETPMTSTASETSMTSTETEVPMTWTATETPMTSTAINTLMTSTETETPMTTTASKTPMTSTETETPMTSTALETPITSTAPETPMTSTATETLMTSTAIETPMNSTAIEFSKASIVTTITEPLTISTADPLTGTTELHGRVDLCPYWNLAQTFYSNKTGYPLFRQLGNYCYEVRQQMADWYTANDDCSNRHGELVTINNEAIQDELHQMLVDLHMDINVWTGLNDVRTEGTWTWNKGEVLSDTAFTNWDRKGSGLVYQQRQDCVVINGRTGTWRGVVCKGFLLDTQRHPWICQYKM